MTNEKSPPKEGEEGYGLYMYFRNQFKEEDTNARLFAAASDLLDVLRQWKAGGRNNDAEEIYNAMVKRDALLAKIDGEEG